MAEKKFIEINGLKHFFVEYIKDEDKPVVLYVHGGPAVSESLVGWEMAAATDACLNWIFYDERGSGRTYLCSPESVGNYEELYGDLLEILKHLNARFERKIYLMAHNYGTIMALRIARDFPEYVAGYIGYSQLIDMAGISKVRLERVKKLAAIAGSKHDIKLADKIFAAAGEDVDRDKLTSKQISRMNVLFSKYNVAGGADKNLMTRIPKSPLYDMSDLKILMGAPKMGAHLAAEVRNVNLFSESMKYEVPVMFIAGDWDYQCPCTVAAEYIDKMEAPYKKMALIKDVGASAMTDAPVEFWDEVKSFFSCT